MFPKKSKIIIHRKSIQVLVIILFFGVFLFIQPFSFFQGIREILWMGTAPFMHVAHKIGSGLSHTAQIFSSIGDVRDENEYLRQKIIELESFEAQHIDSQRENNVLREALDLLPRDMYTLETSAVIGHDPSGTHKWIVINKGKKHGLEKGMPVIVRGGILVGSLEEVFYTTSQVKLITHPESAINAHVASTHAKGLVRGRYGLGILMDRILQTESVQVGESVVTSEIGELFPPGLYIGKVQEIRRSEDNLFQQAVLVSPVDLTDLLFISVIKK